MLLINYTVFFAFFMKAYFHPTKSILITINTVGEAKLEFVLMIIGLPFVIYFIKKTFTKHTNSIEKPYDEKEHQE